MPSISDYVTCLHHFMSFLMIPSSSCCTSTFTFKYLYEYHSANFMCVNMHPFLNHPEQCCMMCPEEDYSTVVETLAIDDILKLIIRVGIEETKSQMLQLSKFHLPLSLRNCILWGDYCISYWNAGGG